MQHVRDQIAFGPRPTGSAASFQTGEYILQTLSGYGWATESQPFDYLDVTGRNLVGKAGQADGPIFLIGAHYDTRIFADEDPDAPEEPVPGANDGASGVAVLLELARVLDLSAVQGEVWLVFFDAEDNGRIGEWDWIVGSTIFDELKETPPEYVIIEDMIGDADQNIYYERTSDVLLREHLWEIAASLGYEEYFIPQPKYAILDDHTPFLNMGIPAVDIIDFDYPYWHTLEDTTDKVSAASLQRVGRVLEVFLEAGGTYPAD
ncbi:MAG: M28 family peptidase [Anaerolineae bacterium]